MTAHIIQHRIVPVATLEDAADAVPLAEALAAGGLPILEVTLRTSAGLEAIRLIRSHCPHILIGSGTVLSPQQVSEVVAVGAQFGLSPGLNTEVVRAAQQEGLLFIPGVMTPSDVEAALCLDCRLVKFFPAGPAGGVPMLEALTGPFGHTGIQFVPLGGVSESNMADYLRVPGVPAVGGSWICDRALIRQKRWGDITRIVQAAVASAASVKKPTAGS